MPPPPPPPAPQPPPPVVHDGLTPDIIPWDDQCPDYAPLFDRSEIQFRSSRFEMPQRITPSVDALQRMFWPDHVISDMVRCTNAYAKDNIAPSRYKEVKDEEMFKFFAAITYMGVVRLPSKEDYFDDRFGKHPTIHLSKTRFLYIWRAFHTCYTTQVLPVVHIGPYQVQAQPI